MYVHTISLYEETVRTSYKQKLTKKWYIHTYHFFVRRNGAYVPFLCTKKWCVHTVSSYKEMVRICTTNGMYLVQRKAYEETVRMYIPFLCMKKRCIRTISCMKKWYVLFLHTKKQYVHAVSSCVTFLCTLMCLTKIISVMQICYLDLSCDYLAIMLYPLCSISSNPITIYSYIS